MGAKWQRIRHGGALSLNVDAARVRYITVIKRRLINGYDAIFGRLCKLPYRLAVGTAN